MVCILSQSKMMSHVSWSNFTFFFSQFLFFVSYRGIFEIQWKKNAPKTGMNVMLKTISTVIQKKSTKVIHRCDSKWTRFENVHKTWSFLIQCIKFQSIFYPCSCFFILSPLVNSRPVDWRMYKIWRGAQNVYTRHDIYERLPLFKKKEENFVFEQKQSWQIHDAIWFPQYGFDAFGMRNPIGACAFIPCKWQPM